MLIKEYRITMPLSVAEYQIGQLYSVAEASIRETGGGEGVEVLRNEPFENKQDLLNGKFTKGQYTYKVYHLASKIPALVRYILPKGMTEVYEEAWNAYPYCRTVITNPDYMKKNFSICIETMHYADNGQQENIHQLSVEKLKMREVVHLDIANDSVSSKDYKESEDPKRFHSEKTGRGPLVDKDWKNTVEPVMTCYKLVTCEFKWYGFQGRVENLIQTTERRLFLNFHRQVFCTLDKWHGKTIDEIRKYEEETKRQLDELRSRGTITGYSVD